MKKTILLSFFIAVSSLMGSCSGGDDDANNVVFVAPPTEAISFKLNNELKAYENISVQTSEGQETISSRVTATEKENPENKISFEALRNKVTNVSILKNFRYYENNVVKLFVYQLTASTTVHNTHLIRATFSGIDGEDKITDGVLNIYY